MSVESVPPLEYSVDAVPEEQPDVLRDGDSVVDRFLAKTPWRAISVAFHTIVLLILYVVKIGAVPEQVLEVVIEARIEEKEEPEYEPERERDLIRRDSPLLETNVEAEVEIVVTEEVQVDDHFETDDDMDMETARGFEDAIGFVDAGSIGIVSSIGVGGGGRGGRYGFRWGGGRKNADGSWPPVDYWCTRWSRPGMTALCALCLEVYYRYMPIYMGGS